MKAKINKTNVSILPESPKGKVKPQEYPLYPADDDIYSKYKKEADINPEDVSEIKKSSKKSRTSEFDEMEFSDFEVGSDLDVPGSELDDDEELIGSEDEENNYYSLGGDDHNDLDEDNG